MRFLSSFCRGAERRCCFPRCALTRFERSIHGPALPVRRRSLAREEQRIVNRRRQYPARISASHSNITVCAARERIAAPVMHDSTFELLADERGFTEYRSEPIERTLDDFFP